MFYRSTLREVSVMVRGAQWRQEQDARLAIITAHMTASLMRVKRIPSISTLLHRAAERQIRTPSEQKSFLLDWAFRAKKRGRDIHVGRLARPFDPRTLDPATSPSMRRRLARG